MSKLALHWKIVIGMIAGILFGLSIKTLLSILSQLLLKLGIHVSIDHVSFVTAWIKPFGIIFINLLKLIAIPLILASLIKGVSDLHDIKKFRSMGIWTFLIYVATTVIAVSVGLIMVNTIR